MLAQEHQPISPQTKLLLATIARSVLERATSLRILALNLLHDRTDLSDITLDDPFLNVYRQCKVHTMTSIMRMQALYNATRYPVNSMVAADFVECGVWRGGTSMLV